MGALNRGIRKSFSYLFRMMMISAPQKKPVIVPAGLNPGDAVGIAAPAGAFDPERFDQGVRVIESLGFTPVIPEAVFERKRYLAGSDARRADLLNRLFRDESVKAIMCARGGFGSLNILSRLDFQAIGENPKIFAGFSDISVLLSVIFEKTGLVTFHAPVVTSLAEAGERTKKALVAAFTNPQAMTLSVEAGVTVAPGRADGVVRGGNLASLCQMTGTPYQPDFRGSLLLLEDVNEAPYRIDRMLSQMRLAGCLDDVAGVMLGGFDRCGDTDEIHDIVKSRFPSGIPILGGLPVGHDGENLALPLGLTATLDADRHLLQYHAPPVSSGYGKIL